MKKIAEENFRKIYPQCHLHCYLCNEPTFLLPLPQKCQLATRCSCHVAVNTFLLDIDIRPILLRMHENLSLEQSTEELDNLELHAGKIIRNRLGKPKNHRRLILLFPCDSNCQNCWTQYPAFRVQLHTPRPNSYVPMIMNETIFSLFIFLHFHRTLLPA